MPRFYDPQNGDILIDEQNTRSVNLKSLRKSISLVSQDVILFDSSVKDNILYANTKATENEFFESVNLLQQMNLLMIYLLSMRQL